jgi:capsular polysaccharide biosynthesis protein
MFEKFQNTMLIRISLILAVVAALAAGALNFFVVKDKLDTLVTDRNTQRDGWHETSRQLNQTSNVLVKTQGTLKQTQQELADSQVAQKKAEDLAAAQVKKATDLSGQLARTTQERNDAQNNLEAYKATGFSSDQVSRMSRDNKDLKDAIAAADAEKSVLSHKIASLTSELEKYKGSDPIVRLRADLTGKIVQVDPKWDFVVLNIGDNQGVLQDGELLVSRNGKLVAKVIVRTVEKDRCIANVVPGWKLGELFEGDVVSPAHPAS